MEDSGAGKAVMLPGQTQGNSISYQNSSIRRDCRRIKKDLGGKLLLLSDIFKKAELELQNKLLSVVIYKHSNQLRKYKTLQYAKRILKMVARLDSKTIITCLEELRMHIDNSCNCFWNKKNDLSCNERQTELVNEILCKVGVIIEVLRSCKSAVTWAMINLKSKTFLTFNAFMLSHFCRIRVVMLRMVEEFIVVLRMMEILDMIARNEADQFISLKHEFLFENEAFLMEANDIVGKDDHLLNCYPDATHFREITDAMTGVQSSGEEQNNPTTIEEYHPFVKRQFYTPTRTDTTKNILHDTADKPDLCDIGVSIARKDMKEMEFGMKHFSVDTKPASSFQKSRSNFARSGLEVRRKKSNFVSCYCWKCQQYKKYFQHLSRSSYFGKSSLCKERQIESHWRRKKIVTKKMKARTSQETTSTKEVQNLQKTENKSFENSPMVSGRFLEPRILSARMDDIDLIFDQL